MILRFFGPSLGITTVALVCALCYGGPKALILTLILGVLEVSLSFDNAIINATILQRMTAFWQRMFLTVGVVIAVFGMRLMFPLVIVAISAHLDPIRAFDLATHQPHRYQDLLHAANPKISAFGGAFLLMLFLDFVFTPREVTWLTWLERPLARLGKMTTSNVVITLGVVLLTGGYITPDPEAAVVMAAGSLGLITYIVANGLSELFGTGGHGDTERRGPDLGRAAGRAGLFLFIYLEMLDASFSFDGVVGAFAITSDPVVIALGLGLIGAMFVRSITVYLVHQGTLAHYAYLEHGAHWAIGALAVTLLISTGHRIDEMITGFVGVAIIAAAFLGSIVRNGRRGDPTLTRC